MKILAGISLIAVLCLCGCQKEEKPAVSPMSQVPGAVAGPSAAGGAASSGGAPAKTNN
jgi:hypothetical protein